MVSTPVGVLCVFEPERGMSWDPRGRPVQQGQGAQQQKGSEGGSHKEETTVARLPDRVKSCEGKKRFDRKDKKRVKRWARREMGSGVKVYRCIYCHGYHVGHDWGKAPEGYWEKWAEMKGGDERLLGGTD